MYKVIKAFTDLHDEDYPYSVGDSFPRVGINVTEKRLKELSGCENKQGMPLIEKVADEALPAEAVHIGRRFSHSCGPPLRCTESNHWFQY